MTRPFLSLTSLCTLTVLLLLLLTSPLWVWSLVSPIDAYKTPTMTSGTHAAIGELISKSPEVDVLFVGSSNMWTAIDHKALAASFFELENRRLRSLTVAQNWNGEDINYIQIKNYLKSGTAKLIFLEAPREPQIWPHNASKFFLNVWDDDGFFWSLPWRVKVSLYAEQILYSPRLLFSLIREEHVFTNEVLSAIENKGSHIVDKGFENEKFHPFDASPPSVTLQEAIITESRNDVHLAVGEMGSKKLDATDWETLFWERIEVLAKNNNIRVFFVHFSRLQEPRDRILVRPFELDGVWPTIGLSIASSFPGISVQDQEKFYYDIEHTNSNGARHFGAIFGHLISDINKKYDLGIGSVTTP